MIGILTSSLATHLYCLVLGAVAGLLIAHKNPGAADTASTLADKASAGAKKL